MLPRVDLLATLEGETGVPHFSGGGWALGGDAEMSHQPVRQRDSNSSIALRLLTLPGDRSVAHRTVRHPPQKRETPPPKEVCITRQDYIVTLKGLYSHLKENIREIQGNFEISYFL